MALLATERPPLMSLLLIDERTDDATPERDPFHDAALASILADLEDFGGVEETVRDSADEVRALGREAAARTPAVSPPRTIPVPVPTAVVAGHIAALEDRLTARFDLSALDGADDQRRLAARVPVAGEIEPETALPDEPGLDPERAVGLVAAPPDGVESYAVLAGADDDLDPDVPLIVPLALTPSDAMSPAAAAAKRAGRRRLVLALAVLCGLISFVGLGAAAAQRARTVDAAESVVSSSTTAPTTEAPAPAPAPTTAAPTTEPPTTVEPTTTAAPVTTASTAPPTTALPTTTSTTRAPTTTVAKPTTSYAVPTTVANYSFLDCVRARESRGDYGAMNASGAHGAYQMMPITARETALRAGRSDLAATPVLNWSKADQDAMAALLYQWQGAAPWGGGCAYPSN
jgi:hypothetical protein